MSHANGVERTEVSIWSAAGATDDGDPDQGRVELRRGLAGLRHLEGLARAGPGVHRTGRGVCARPE
jgi:hypothetical protein